MVIDDPVQIIKEICKLLVVFTFYHHHELLLKVALIKHPLYIIYIFDHLYHFVSEPLSINAPQLTYTPTIGTLVILVCDVTGPATIVRWYKNNSPSPINIAADSRLTNGDVNNPSLSINNVQASDSGQYVCQATDGSKTVNTNTITVNAQCRYLM